jgi:SAM-dependent methyltransferase
MPAKEQTRENVKEYYGKHLQGTHDLKTNACCSSEYAPTNHREILSQIDEEILTKFYGCGSPIPPELDGCTVLDLGCGSGRDVYLASKLVGAKGFVYGIDMTDEQLAVADRHIDSQTKRFGFKKPNVAFKKGYIEDLGAAGIKDNSIDVVISNCVINLSPDKRRVFSEIFRALKPGGELYFSDVFSGCRVPEKLKDDPVLYGECLSGALYIEDFRRMLREVGCPDYRVTFKKPIILSSQELAAKVGMIDFYSMTIRAFKLDSLEDICEDYGQVAVYKGTIEDSPHSFVLDDHHTFIAGKPMLVCGNTAAMLSETRYAKHFRITGDRKTHYGPFDCASMVSKKEKGDQSVGGSCC